jgi:hypothetical protein
MQHQRASEAAWTSLTTLRNDIYTFRAVDSREQSLQDKAMDKVQDAYDARRTRVDLINAGVPDFLWFTLLGGAVLVTLFPLLTKPHLTAHLIDCSGDSRPRGRRHALPCHRAQPPLHRCLPGRTQRIRNPIGPT